MVTKKPEKWTRAVLLKRPDNITSSDFTTTEPFIPSYTKKKEPVSMFKLLAMDYARQWHYEKQQIKEVILVSNEATFLQRRYVIRGLLRKLQKAEQDEKRFVVKKPKKMSIPKTIPKVASKESVKTVEKIRKSIPTFKKEVEPCGESASAMSPCSSQADLGEVCQKDDLDKRECRLGGKKTYKREESKIVGEDIKKPESPKKKESDVRRPVPPTPKKEENKRAAVVVAAAKAQVTTRTIPAPRDDSEEGSVCTCSCTCEDDA